MYRYCAMLRVLPARVKNLFSGEAGVMGYNGENQRARAGAIDVAASVSR